MEFTEIKSNDAKMEARCLQSKLELCHSTTIRIQKVFECFQFVQLFSDALKIAIEREREGGKKREKSTVPAAWE